MAFRRSLSSHLNPISKTAGALAPKLSQTPILTQSKTEHTRDYFTSSKPALIKNFLHRRSLYHSSYKLPDLLSLPTGDKLREKLNDINSVTVKDRVHFNQFLPPDYTGIKFSFDDARKLMRLAKLEKIKLALKKIQKSAIQYKDYVQLCVQECGNREQGIEFSKLLDGTGNVIVFGDTVYLRPDQVVRKMATLISESVATPDDPRRLQLDEMEAELAEIDAKAAALAKGEMWCGLAFVVLQTAGFMRLTFWELSWDVMEPICFFVASLQFVGGYLFFLKTATEPSFEGLFRRRFEVKRRGVMAARGFALERYRELRKVVYGELGF